MNGYIAIGTNIFLLSAFSMHPWASCCHIHIHFLLSQVLRIKASQEGRTSGACLEENAL